MIAVRFRASAQRDVQQAFEFFEARSAGLGAEFLERVEQATDRISRNPETYQTVFQEVRRANLKQFKYALFYRIETDGSVVIACLLKLGIDICQTTVAKYLVRRRQPPSQTWRTFLKNHIGQIVAADFFVVPTATYRLLFVLWTFW